MATEPVEPKVIISKTKSIIEQRLQLMVDKNTGAFPTDEIQSLCLLAKTYEQLDIDDPINSIMLNIPIIINERLKEYGKGQYPTDEVGCLCEMKSTYSKL
jgi:hypothetical protein